MDFTKLSEVEALEEVPEGVKVLVEVDGAIKRAPGEGLGGSGSSGIIMFVCDDDSGDITCNVTFDDLCVQCARGWFDPAFMQCYSPTHFSGIAFGMCHNVSIDKYDSSVVIGTDIRPDVITFHIDNLMTVSYNSDGSISVPIPS